MTTDQLKREAQQAQPVPKTLHMSNIPHTVNNIQHNIGTINEPLSHTFRESEVLTFFLVLATWCQPAFRKC